MNDCEAMDRRQFLHVAGVMTLAGEIGASAVRGEGASPESQSPSCGNLTTGKIEKAVLYGMLPPSLSAVNRFRLAADLGFAGVEVPTPENAKESEALRTAADKARIRIHSVMNAGSWEFPLSSGDQEIVKRGRNQLERSLRAAKVLGADTVLLVPAVVTPEVRYHEAWERSMREIRRALPLARELDVVVAIENVGNRFLLSPLEFARYVDEIGDPHLKAYFDVGNSLILWSYPEDWILTLGRRIRKIHLKDCDFGRKRFVRLRDGDVNWPGVRRAIEQVRYSGFVTVEPNYRSPELDRGDRNYLSDIARRVDLILAGE